MELIDNWINSRHSAAVGLSEAARAVSQYPAQVMGPNVLRGNDSHLVVLFVPLIIARMSFIGEVLKTVKVMHDT